MNRTSKRPAKYPDYRARPSKRRKANRSGHEPIYDTSARERFQEEEGVWPVHAILQERGSGKQKAYLIHWDPHPRTGEIFDHSWEPAWNVGTDLIEGWKQKTRVKKIKQDDDYQPSQRLESVPQRRPSLLDGIQAGGPVERARRSRPVIDSSSDIETDHRAEQASFTPDLASSPASTPADEFGSDSPSLEILESQHQPSAAPAFSLNIPNSAIDKSEYESYHSSQVPDSNKTPLSPTTLAEQRTSRSSAHPHQPAVSSPLSQHTSQGISAAHQSLADAVNSSAPPSSQRNVQIPASSDTANLPNHLSVGTASSQQNSGSQVLESSPAVGTTRVVVKAGSLQLRRSSRKQGSQSSDFSASQVRPRTESIGAKSAHLLSSAQQLSYLSTSQQSNLFKALEPIDTATQQSPSSPPWVFQSQLPIPHSILNQSSQSRLRRAGRRRFKNGGFGVDHLDSQLETDSSKPTPHLTQRSPAIKMDMPGVRQSPQLRASTPVKGTQSPKIGPGEHRRRARTPRNDDRSSAKQDNAPSLSVQDYSRADMAGLHDQRSKPTPTPSFTSAEAYAPEPGLVTGLTTQQSVYDTALGASALPIQQSIEEEPPSSAEETSIVSKASSSQASLENERIIPQVDGISLPCHPVLGPAEYTIALPAEGKIQSAYADTIKAKRKTILKFISRRDSVGSANGSTTRTMERNEMVELIDQLHDTTTHFDLGLPGFATQYSIKSEEAAAYAEYAGSKFVFLACLIEVLARVDCSVVIASKPGPVQNLVEDFLSMKHVRVTRHDRPSSARSTTPDVHQATLKIDLVDTTTDIDIHLSSRPALILALDASFDNQSPQIKRIRELNSRGRNQLLPVVHLLVSNSSEHVDRCLRKAMPSPQRLKLLVRGTYAARANLGGSPTYVPDPSDEPEGRSMDIHDLQRAVRKSPNRKLNMMAHIVARAAVTEDFEQYWNLGAMPEVQYEELDDTPPKLSQRSTAAGTAAPTPRNGRARSRTPLSRAGTPSGKKRLLDVDDIRIQSLLSKRQRLSPLRDATPVQDLPKEVVKEQINELEPLRQQLKSLQADLATEKEARLKVENEREHQLSKRLEWEKAHSEVLKRYEKRRISQHKLDKENKRLEAEIDVGKEKQEKTAQSNTALKEQVAELKKELQSARDELKKCAVPELVALETAREEARTATAKAAAMAKSLENRNNDFEFTRQQYQQASTRAAELGQQNTDLEAQAEVLKGQASDEKRRLRELHFGETQKKDLAKIDSLEQEKKAMLLVMKKMREELEVLKKGRGVQTRGSSVQPPGSPGLSGIGVGTRSRQGSPAPGTVMSAARDAREALHQGLAHANNRVSGLRNER